MGTRACRDVRAARGYLGVRETFVSCRDVSPYLHGGSRRSRRLMPPRASSVNRSRLTVSRIAVRCACALVPPAPAPVVRVVGVDVTSQCTILFRLTLFVAGTRRNAGRRQCVPRGRAVVPASRVRESQRVVAASVVARRHCAATPTIYRNATGYDDGGF